ncbi:MULTISPECIES: aldo/keto reductase [Streptomyces]|uniref:aldo/keto reductase n=1 Tax=Streptomyces TaxID=1883 RepID=UPI0029AB103E|nr:aldo/keto reductase [Streptomyces europaeiscabiei]MDX3715759.1 aldo/keto reductase [Streptomyces europaeiscabiei]WSG20000.1 aldo/keto reductase [Streptomyces europaeiscabiei]
MRSRKIPGAPLERTELGFGTSAIGNLYRVTPAHDAAAALAAAWDAGIRYFDTAPHYGLGLAEARLGAFLLGRPRQEYAVSSKVGRLLVSNEHPRGADTEGFVVRDDLRRQWDFSRDGVLRSIEDSLRRTGLDRLDIVYLHDPDDHWRQAAEEAMPALADLRDQGVVGAIGAGMNQSAMLARFLRETAADVVMLAGRYTLLDQSALDDVLPAAQESGKSVVAVGVFNSGLLSHEWPAEGMKYDYQEAPPELVARARAIAEVCKGHGISLPVAAMAFPATHPSTVNVTLGMRDRAQVTQNVELQRSAVPRALWDDLRCQGLIRPDVLTTSGTQGTPDRPAPDGRSAAHDDGTRGGSSRCR